MCNYIVTNKEIEKAEKDIFENGLHFNDKQKAFLKCLDSCCVQAYAGTGKTSTIVGKLHVLAQKDVWKNGRGICVISHTNVAVDEIKKHVAKYYPAIMQYPNFIGTIQEYVNKYLFIPYLASKELQIKFQDESRFFDYKLELPANIVTRIDDYIKSKVNHSPDSARARKEFFNRLKTVHLVDGKLYARTKNSQFAEYTDLKTKKVSQNEIVKALSSLIQKKHNDGYFLFAESFIYGYEYLKQNQILKDIIAQRFQFVFVDEAQDCSEIQLKILNELFNNSSKTVFQQIGDTNQAISETEWKPQNYLDLTQSTRFGDNIAGFINKFQADNGCGVSGTTDETKQYLITYGSGKEKDVLPKFAEILKNKNVSTDKGFFAISHRHEHLSKYFLEYSEKLAKNKSKKISYRFDRDIEYIDMLTKEAILQRGSNLVSRAIASLLYKYFKSDDNSWSKLRELLRIGEKSDDFKKLVVRISYDILQNNKISDWENLKNRLNAILVEDKICFTNGSVPSSVPIQNRTIENKFSYNGIEINVGTIHGVKGQTHSATLLFSNEEHGKQDVQHTIDKTKVLTPEFKRRFYVASSRAKNIFAFAIEKSAYDGLKDKSYFSNFESITI